MSLKKLEEARKKSVRKTQELIAKRLAVRGTETVSNVVEEFVKRVKTIQEEEKNRVIFLVDQAIQDHLFTEREMFEKESFTYSHHFLDVHERGLKVLEQLKECITSGVLSFEPVAPPKPRACGKDSEESFVGVCEETEATCEEQEDSSIEEDQAVIDDAESDDALFDGEGYELKQNIIGIMQMAGTVKDGVNAWWTLDQLSVGLSKMYPFLGDETLAWVVGKLSEDHVIIQFEGGSFALSDDFATKPAEISIEDEIITILKSAKEEGGEYCGWTQNQLVFAVKRSSARLSETAIRETMEEMIQAGCIVSFEGKTTSYVAIDEETMKLYKEKLVAINHEPALEEARIEEPVEELAEPTGKNGDPRTWEEVKKALKLDEQDNAVALSIITHMRQEPKRLWRDYDFDGLYKTALNKISMKGTDGEPGELRVALDSLVENGLVEHIPRDTRPGIHEERWGLTELGRLVI